MTDTEKILLFLASETQTDEVIDLMRIAKAIETRCSTEALIAFVQEKKAEAQQQYLQNNKRNNDMLNRYISWQRVLYFITKLNE